MFTDAVKPTQANDDQQGYVIVGTFRTAVARWSVNRFKLATYVVAGIGAVLALLSIGADPRLSLLIAAVLCGWSELDGLCGSSHACTLTPMQAMQPRSLWLRAVTAYTIAGVFSAALVGGILGAVGDLVHARSVIGVLAIASLSLILGARELGWLRMRLPQVRRQTVKMWAFEFGVVPAAAMWGAHIGIGFATVIKHGGFFVVVACAVVLGPVYGAAIMIAYWLGRALPLWVARLLLPRCDDGSEVSAQLQAGQPAYEHAAAIGLFLAFTAATLLVI